MDDRDKKIAELELSLKHRKTWFDRLQDQYTELNEETNLLRQRVEELARERDSLLGDVTKLKARVAELEAKLPVSPGIILP